MSVYTWPDAPWAVPSATELRVVDTLQRVSESPLSGAVQTLSMPGARWGWGYDFDAQPHDARMQLEAWLIGLSGRQHRVRLWDTKRTRPRGSINLSGVTTSGSAAQFAEQLTLQGCGAGKTLLMGDWLATPTQLLRCTEDAVANGSGVMVVKVRHMLRAAVASGTAITLDKPTALYIRTEANLAARRELWTVEPPLACEFVEVFA